MSGDRLSSQASAIWRSVARAGRRSRPGCRARAAPEGIEGHEDDPFARAVVDDVLVLALRDVEVVLHRRDREQLPGAFDLLDADLGQPDAPDRALLVVLGEGGEAPFERRLGVDPVQVVELDGVGAQPPGSPRSGRVRTPGRPRRAVAALGGDQQLRSGLAAPIVVLALAARVEVSGVDVAYARGDGLADQRHMLRRVGEAIRSQSDARLGVHAPGCTRSTRAGTSVLVEGRAGDRVSMRAGGELVRRCAPGAVEAVAVGKRDVAGAHVGRDLDRGGARRARGRDGDRARRRRGRGRRRRRR